MDLISKLGYSRYSPYQNSPFLDIKSPNGLIDMSNTDMPLLGIGLQTGATKFLRPGTGLYSFPGDKVIREINLNLPKYNKSEDRIFSVNPYAFGFNPISGVNIFGIGAKPAINLLNTKKDKLALTGDINTVSVGYPGGQELFTKPQYGVGLKYTHTFKNGGSTTTETTIPPENEKEKKAREFLTSMINSPLFGQRYATMTGRRLRDINPKEIEDYRTKLLNNLNTVYSAPIGVEPRKSMFISEEELPLIAGVYFENPPEEGKPGHSIWLNKGFDDQTTTTHEYSHATTRSSTDLPYAPRNPLNYNAILAGKRIKGSETKFGNEGQKKYLTTPTEIKGRKDAVAQFLQEQGVWDPVNERFGKKQYDYLKNLEKEIDYKIENNLPFDENFLGPLGQWQEISLPYRKKDTYKIFNEIVRNDNNKNKYLSFAKKGGQATLDKFYKNLFENINKRVSEEEDSSFGKRALGAIETVVEDPLNALKFLLTKKQTLSNPWENPYAVDFISDRQGNVKKTWAPKYGAVDNEPMQPYILQKPVELKMVGNQMPMSTFLPPTLSNIIAKSPTLLQQKRGDYVLRFQEYDEEGNPINREIFSNDRKELDDIMNFLSQQGRKYNNISTQGNYNSVPYKKGGVTGCPEGQVRLPNGQCGTLEDLKRVSKEMVWNDNIPQEITDIKELPEIVIYPIDKETKKFREGLEPVHQYSFDQFVKEYGPVNITRKKGEGVFSGTSGYYNPFTNTINIKPNKFEKEYWDDYNDTWETYLAELAHKKQFKERGLVSTGLNWLTSDLPSYAKSKYQELKNRITDNWDELIESPYSTPGTVEYEAHSLIEPQLNEVAKKLKDNYYDYIYYQGMNPPEEKSPFKKKKQFGGIYRRGGSIYNPTNKGLIFLRPRNGARFTYRHKINNNANFVYSQ